MTLSPRAKKALKIAREVLITILFVAVTVYVVGRLRAPDLPDVAPPFSLMDLNGEVVSLADFRGKTVVLNFWATWCGPCRFEIPALSRFAKNNPEIAVVGIIADAQTEDIKAVALELGADYINLRGTDRILKEYGVTTFPTTVIIDKDGNVVLAHTGLMLDPQLAWATM